MRFIRNKTAILLAGCAGLLLFSCRKVTLSSEDKTSNLITITGKDFVFPSTFGGREVMVSVPAGAVTGKSYLEFYQCLLGDGNAIDSFYVNDTLGDLNLLISDGKDLQVPATVKIPFYFSPVYTTASGYLPYRVRAEDYTDLMKVLNEETNWEPVTDFTYDNSTKHLIFETNNLSGIYVVAKRK